MKPLAPASLIASHATAPHATALHHTPRNAARSGFAKVGLNAGLLAGVLAGLLALAAPAAHAADAAADSWLVSPAEALAFQGQGGFEEPPALRMRAVVPLIEILKPEPTADLKVVAPFAIQVQFRSQADAEIVPDTFKVMYGALKFDITSRITKYVKVTPEGFVLDNAKIPAGKHRLTLQVQDSKQRVAERELRVEVE